MERFALTLTLASLPFDFLTDVPNRMRLDLFAESSVDGERFAKDTFCDDASIGRKMGDATGDELGGGETRPVEFVSVACRPEYVRFTRLVCRGKSSKRSSSELESE